MSSLEQTIEEYSRHITQSRDKILDDFFKAYVAQLAHLGHDVILDDICLVQQLPDYKDGGMTTKYWFEYKPKFNKEDLE